MNIIALTECWLNSSFSIPPIDAFNYVYKLSVLGRAGGLVLYTNKNLDVQEIVPGDDFTTSSSEFLCVELVDFKIIIILVYRHHADKISCFINCLDNLLSLHQFNKHNYRYLLCGDMNIDLLKKCNNTSLYLSTCRDHGFSCLLKATTRNHSCLDHVFEKTATDFLHSTITTHDLEITDHSTIVISTPVSRQPDKKPKLFRLHNTKTISHFINNILQVNWSELVNDSRDINTNTDAFIDKLLNLYYKSFPLVKPKIKKNKPLWFDSELAHMAKHKNFLLRKTRRRNCAILKSRFTAYNAIFKKRLSSKKISFCHKSLNLANNNKKWKLINFFLNKSATKQLSSLTCFDFKDHYSNIFSVSYPINDINITYSISQTMFLSPTNVTEVSNAFNKLPKKSTKQDHDLPSFLWHTIGPYISHIVCFLINQMLTTGEFPRCLKNADITPIYKKGNKNEAKNFRPITILHNLSKVYERIIYIRLLNFVLTHNILPSCQYGFRPKHSVRDAVVDLLFKIESNYLNNKKSCAIFLDLSRAFDCVNHNKLIQILYSLGIRGHGNQLIKSYLTDRQFRIKYNEDTSCYSPILRGVPQGGLLSPLLYNLYVFNFSSLSRDVIQYADDSTIIIPFDNCLELQFTLDILSSNLCTYFNHLDLSLNVNKTQMMLFNSRDNPTLQLCNQSIIPTDSVCFLGTVIDNQRKFHLMADSIISKIKRTFPLLYRIRHVLTHNTKKLFFSSFVIPYIMFSIPFLLLCSKSSVTKISIVYKRAIKILFNLPFRTPSSLVFLKSGLCSPKSLIDNHCYVYSYKLFYNLLPQSICNFSSKSLHHAFILHAHKDTKSLFNKIALHWNSLPRHTRCSPSLHRFKTLIFE